MPYALIKQGRDDEASVHFRAASALEPGDPTSQLNLGIYAQQHGDLQQAAARYANVLRLATDAQLRASAYANLGTVYFALHDYAQAQQNFDSAMKLNRVFPVALLDMGLIAAKTADERLEPRRRLLRAVRSPRTKRRRISSAGSLLSIRPVAPTMPTWLTSRPSRLSNDIALARQRAAQLLAQ